MKGVSHLRLFCDRFVGQNGNMCIYAHPLLFAWRSTHHLSSRTLRSFFWSRNIALCRPTSVFVYANTPHPVIILKEDYIKLQKEVEDVLILRDDMKTFLTLYENLPGIRDFKKVEIKMFKTNYRNEEVFFHIDLFLR